MQINRVFLIICDSVGCGSTKDSYLYNDEGSNTLLNILKSNPNVELSNLKKLGLYNIIYNKTEECLASYGKMNELSKGKDTLTGHYELMGLLVEEPFKTFTYNGFPDDLINEIERKTGYKVIGNIAASGTEIIKDLGEEHIKNKSLIVYTSSDSVLQIACHEKYFGLENLYSVCEIVRKICLKPQYKVARIIARPFLGEDKTTFYRTPNRHDYALDPFDKTVLDELKESNISVFSFGKIADIYNNNGISYKEKTLNNMDGVDKFINKMKENNEKGLYYINLVDFDSVYGHRRNPEGYAAALKEFDDRIPEILDALNDDDLLIITADHGNDPTWHGTDHTREFVPLLVYNKNLKSKDLKVRESFADVGATIADIFNVKSKRIGKSFKEELYG